MRDYLVFVRAGPSSLHPRLLAEDPHRNWDCYVNAWSDRQVGEALGSSAEFHEPGGLNKFEAFAEAWPAIRKVHAYRFVLMLDDDLIFEPGDVSRFFDYCERENLKIAQPAIAIGSHANHWINIRNPGCEVRRVNFVEVMAPCFSRAALELLLPTFTLTRCTWGIDYAWASMLDGQDAFSIVDAVPMRHTKPMDVDGGPFYQRLLSMGIDPRGELESIHRRFVPWGPMRTMDDGHRYRWAFPQAVNKRLVAWSEQRKKRMHLTAGGTLAPQTPAPSKAQISSADAAPA